MITETQGRLRALVAQRLEVEVDRIDLDARLDNIGLDSYDLMTLIVEIEDTFAPVSLADQSADQLRTLRDVAQYIDIANGRGL